MNLTEAREKTNVLQSSLYKAAVADPGRRFHALYDKLYREDVLQVAWQQVRENNGAPGVDGATIQSIRSGDVTEYLTDLALELKEHRYRPKPARRVEIPKDGGKVRRLGIPTVRDRIVQAAAKLVLEPIFEADFCDASYGFRPGLGQLDALENVRKNAKSGLRVVLDADIESFFDNVNHDRMMEALSLRIRDSSMLRMIWRWLKAGVIVLMEREDTDLGTPQGGVLSPLLANVYLHGMDRSFAEVRPKMGLITRFADDFVVQCGNLTYAEQALEWVKAHLARIGLRLSDSKTRIVMDTEGFDFLGFHHRRVYEGWGASYRWPSQKACKRFRERVREKLHATGFRQTKAELSEVFERIKRYMGGWRHYYRHGQCSRVFEKLDHFVVEAVARYLARCQPRGKKRRRRPWTVFAKLVAAPGSFPRLQSRRDWPMPDYRGNANVRWRAV